MAEVLLALIATIIGIMIGATGIGGFLIIPSFIALLGLPVREAVASALVLGLGSGVLGVWMFSKRGTLDWSVARPLVMAAIVLAFFGAWVSQFLSGRLITVALAMVVIAGSVAGYVRSQGWLAGGSIGRPWGGRPAVIGIGGFSGLVAGVTGAGGPVASIPLMLAAGYSPLLANGVGTVLQLGAGTAGAAIYGLHGLISIKALIWSLPFQVLGTGLGVVLAHRLDQKLATRIVAMIGLAAGVFLLIR